jgi:hypothetical protein
MNAKSKKFAALVANNMVTACGCADHKEGLDEVFAP